MSLKGAVNRAGDALVAAAYSMRSLLKALLGSGSGT
jgi:hypothetical protein